MNLIYGEIVEILPEDEFHVPMGKIRIKGVLKQVPLTLIPDARSGERVLICDGVAISKVLEE